MFETLPDDNIGLEWEPCHQLFYLIDPMPQLRDWIPKIFHVHRQGCLGALGRGAPSWRAWRRARSLFHRTPGFGDSDWTAIIGDLRLGGYKGSIDIEGWHDPVYRGALEMTGQVAGLNHLKTCRGGTYVPNPA